MDDLISRELALKESHKIVIEGEVFDVVQVESLLGLPSAEPETITIEEVSNQLGCATIQSALYWFEFLKTLDSLGFAIVRKKTR